MSTKSKTTEKAPGAERQRALQPDDKRPNEYEPGVHPAIALQRVKALPASELSASDILILQRTIGNRAVQRLLSAQAAEPPASASSAPPVIQAKLMVGAANDHYEQEADRIARQVTSDSGAKPGAESLQRQTDEDESLQRQPLAAPITPLAQRQPEPGEEEELQTSRQGLGQGFEAGSELASRLRASRGGGSPLPETLRSRMERGFGASFEDVRIHTGDESDRLNQSLQARAFTTGQDLYFKRGEYNPTSQEGQKLIAHELTHVVQQTGKRGGSKMTHSTKMSLRPEPAIQRIPLSDEEREDKLAKEAELKNLEEQITAKEKIIGGYEKDKEEKIGKDRLNLEKQITTVRGEIQVLKFQKTKPKNRLAFLEAKEKAPTPEEEKAKAKEDKEERKKDENAKAKKKAENLGKWKLIIDDAKQASAKVKPIRDAALKGLKKRLKRHDPSVDDLLGVRVVKDGLLDQQDVDAIKGVYLNLFKAKQEADKAKGKIEAIDHRTSEEEVEGYGKQAKDALALARAQKVRVIPKRIESKNRLDKADDYEKAAKSIKFKYQGTEKLPLVRTYTTLNGGRGWGGEHTPQTAEGWLVHTHRDDKGKLTKVHAKDQADSDNRADIPTAENKKALDKLGVKETDLTAGGQFEKDGRTYKDQRAQTELKNHREGK